MPEGQLDIIIMFSVIMFALMLVSAALARSIHNARALSGRDAAEFDALAAIEAQTADDPCAFEIQGERICGHARAAHRMLARDRVRGACADRDCDCPGYVAERPELVPVEPFDREAVARG